ncbi:MAG: xanthine dehydrogenase family protein molybdopterin-binding subunit [Sphingobacteriales bacterium]|nr:xanthine dehydrogenase family protein molybdopterin-binding subunit [Sphingobacteriales bacterium]
MSTNNSLNRRKFIKVSALTGGGMLLSFNLLTGCKPSVSEAAELPKEWFQFNGYLKIGDNGLITLMSPNPEIGQNVKTSMPMMVAEELDVNWKKVIVEQAPLNTDLYKPMQLAGGSNSISASWQTMRTAGATAREMLKQAAANEWKVPVSEIETIDGKLIHKASGKSADYGEFASAASKLTVPEKVALKKPKDFKIIGTSRKNVDGQKIATGKPLFGLDYKEEGMLIAMIVHPPAFGLQLKESDVSAIKSMPGIADAFFIDVYPDSKNKQWCDVAAFTKLLAVVGKSTWQVMQAKKTFKPETEPIKASSEKVNVFGTVTEVITPAGFENTTTHKQQMASISPKQVKTVRKDGDPEAAFKKASVIIERSYSCPFLAHNAMEPMNFFANVKDGQATLVGPVQTPSFMEKSVSDRLGIPLDKVEVKMTRMGGGFGRRLYGHFLVEAALISQKMKAPVKLIYTREDDMTNGVYRPAYYATYRAALDENKNLIAFHVKAGGIPENALMANRYPAGAVENYLAEEWAIPTNISVGAFRAPGSNFIAGAEQSFLDEVAEAMGKDPIEMRLELFEKAKSNPVGKNNDYNADRYAGVLKLVKEKSEWSKTQPGISRGVAAYFCHDSYVAHVFDISIKNNKPVIEKVTTAVDCGIVVNPDAATNLSEGAVTDAVGHAMFSGMTFTNGVPDQSNFDKYRMIRNSEAPKKIETHFVKNEIDPTGMGEPSGPPAIGALANALYKATGKRYYVQPFMIENQPIHS